MDAEMQREHRDDLVPVDGLAVLVDREHPVAVAVERDTKIEVAAAHELLQRRKIGGAAADVDVAAVRFVADRLDLRTEPLERTWRKPRIRAVCAVDRNAQPMHIGAETLEDVLEITVCRDVDSIDLAAAARRRGEQRLDLLLRGVGQLAPLPAADLPPAVLR